MTSMREIFRILSGISPNRRGHLRPGTVQSPGAAIHARAQGREDVVVDAMIRSTRRSPGSRSATSRRPATWCTTITCIPRKDRWLCQRSSISDVPGSTSSCSGSAATRVMIMPDGGSFSYGGPSEPKRRCRSPCMLSDSAERTRVTDVPVYLNGSGSTCSMTPAIILTRRP